MQFETKGRTLINLKNGLTTAEVPDLEVFSVDEWSYGSEKIKTRLCKKFGSKLVIVRSSSFSEDMSNCSNAGAFLSVPNVSVEQIDEAINRVIQSYKKDERKDEVIVQEMVGAVDLSGVVFSHDPNSGAPYRVINWSTGDDTSYVTSGKGGHLFYAAANSALPRSSRFTGIFTMLDELLQTFDYKPIDCEFAVTKEASGEKVWLLQVRPLVINKNIQSGYDQKNSLQEIEAWLRQSMGSHPFLLGKNTIYGVMPDWNPAEIVGLRPYPLALSLYRELVTDSIWAYQRHNYGYRNLRSFPLMSSLQGLPYVDVRLSFNSFIPSTLDDSIADKLVNYYLSKLEDKPHLHDKIEFEIVFSCFALDLPEKLSGLMKRGFNRTEISKIKGSLLRLTNKIIDDKKGLWKDDQKKLTKLEKRRIQILNSDAQPLEKIYWLIEDGKRYGTLPFAGLARAAFIAVQMIKSFVAVGIFSEQDEETFHTSISTVSKQLTLDKNNLSKEKFLAKYGHLRPGTYDILSPRYDDQPDLYFDWSIKNQICAEKEFKLNKRQRDLLNAELSRHGLCVDADRMMYFCKKAIELREFAKFEFTKNLSEVLRIIEVEGKKFGLDKHQLKYSNIQCFFKSKLQPIDFMDELKKSMKEGRIVHNKSLTISLPSLITKPTDVWSFNVPDTVPNYVTQKKVVAEICTDQSISQLAGKVVLIPNADPGFDWLFSHKIAGLVTAWGGINSHMAIRAGELGLPAVVGVGEKSFNELTKAISISIDCATKSVSVLR